PEPKPCNKFEAQAFRTASTLFRVIDNNTQDVIVPYNGEAEELIRQLDDPTANTAALLRKAQRYTVSIYSGTERRLYENNALRTLGSGAAALDKPHYSNEYGVDIEGAEKEVLIF
ncbi:MAG: CRISPR-associated helicase/endonuclease Cas3, partial [Ruminococcus sp.]|nr:CRISPR-associated helicase/endonuclease Cas3 [Ruminococcus sp.]